ncbi:hypothetical protein CEUSTIGMA_g5919.t1 [Chlamydomonas eustigma]|uniref:Protein kinase domain-containing protein n=1 Tax=Chlamydomonas eustigma TaxID=1157962 RepID=A0A250X6U2_9CHLO|nr:hypothetical protein CEUSTIGMA_g5919.t1 [Chlamydomonas eustigma]|eukprot:GAX78480.1 hypothetical protein CEUSTIGMA_g5919.t1 [Chlamydomonas eustigma]
MNNNSRPKSSTHTETESTSLEASLAALLSINSGSVSRCSSPTTSTTLLGSHPSLKSILHLEKYQFVSDPDPSFARTASASSLSRHAESSNDRKVFFFKRESCLVTDDLVRALRKKRDEKSMCQKQNAINARWAGYTSAAQTTDLVSSNNDVVRQKYGDSDNDGSKQICGDEQNLQTSTSMRDTSFLDHCVIMGAPQHPAVTPAVNCSNTLVTSATMPPEMERDVWSVQDFLLSRLVHSGYASDVYKATCKTSRQEVALKVYAVEQMDDLSRAQLAREIRLHSKCHHTNIVNFFAAFVVSQLIEE